MYVTIENFEKARERIYKSCGDVLSIRQIKVEEVEIIKENVEFKLPKELRDH